MPLDSGGGGGGEGGEGEGGLGDGGRGEGGLGDGGGFGEGGGGPGLQADKHGSKGHVSQMSPFAYTCKWQPQADAIQSLQPLHGPAQQRSHSAADTPGRWVEDPAARGRIAASAGNGQGGFQNRLAAKSHKSN